jgi:hypothetical protein
VRRLQLVLDHALFDRLANAERLPQGFGDMNDTQVMNALDPEVGNLNRLTPGNGPIEAAIDQDTSNAVDQAFQDIVFESIGTAETVDDLGLGPLRRRIPDVLSEGIILDHGAIAVSAFGAAEVHA